MKRKVSVFLTLVMCLSLCACGQGKSSTSDSTPNSSAVSGTTATKGTKKDPYKLGEEIKFSTCDLSEENRFDVTLTIKELSAEEQDQAGKMAEDHSPSSTECLGIEFILESQDGSFSNSISSKTTSQGCFVITAYTDSMTETHFWNFTHESSKDLDAFYADTQYDLYMNYADAGDYSMLSIEYCTGEYDTNTIWVELS